MSNLQMSFETVEKIDGIGRTMNRVVSILEKLVDKNDNLNTRVKAIESNHNKLFQELLESQEHTREWVETVRERANDHKEQILKAVADVRTDGEIISNNQKVLDKRIGEKRKRKDDDVSHKPSGLLNDLSPYQWNQEYKEQCVWMLNSVEDHYPDVYKKVQESFEKRQSKNKWNLSVHNDVYDLTESNEGLPKRASAYVESVPNKEPVSD